MARSNFKKQNLNKVQELTRELVSAVTFLTPHEENFQRAEEFMMDKFENNPF
jgi:hypothetical protein